MSISSVMRFFLFLLIISNESLAGDLVKEGHEPGSLIFLGKTYQDIIGDKDGFSRSLIRVNNSPALYVGNRDSQIYSLRVHGGRLVIDCAYIETRNIYNAAGVRAGICGLDQALSPEYFLLGQEYSNIWIDKIFSFDTSDTYRNGKTANFLLGNIGDINIYNRYSSVESLNDSNPEAYIKTSKGCHYFGLKKIFLIFLKRNALNIKYIDILESEEPMILRRLDENELKELPVSRCM